MSIYGIKELVFRNLYDDVWAALLPGDLITDMRKIVFPEGFSPETGRKYGCYVCETLTRKYVFENETFVVCKATLVDAAGMEDVIEHKSQARKPFGNSLALKLAAVKKESLPPAYETIVLRVVRDRKKGGLMFEPHYRENDPIVSGSSMLFFDIPEEEREKLFLGDLVRTRVKKYYPTPLKNSKGATIIKTTIMVLEKIHKAA
jgi:hypothetical protein